MKKMESYAQIQLKLSNLQYDEIPLKRCEKRCFFARFSHVFRSALMGFLILQIGELELNLSITLHLFRISHFLVQ